jgi:hypothetical protein
MGRKGTKPTAGTAADAQVEVGKKGTKRRAVDIHSKVDASNVMPSDENHSRIVMNAQHRIDCIA